MTDRLRGREVAGVQRVGHQFERDGAIGQRRRLIDQLFALGILDPELAEVGADAVDCALMSLRRSPWRLRKRRT